MCTEEDMNAILICISFPWLYDWSPHFKIQLSKHWKSMIYTYTYISIFRLDLWRNSFWSLAHKNETSTFNLSHTDTVLSSNISICNYIFMHSVDRISGGGLILSRKYLGLGIRAQEAAFQPPDDCRLPGAPGLLRCLYLHQPPCRYRVDIFISTPAPV